MKLAQVLSISALAVTAGCSMDTAGPAPLGASAANARYVRDAAARTADAGRNCFRSTEIRKHTKLDDQTLLFNVRGQEVWEVKVRGPCLAGSTSTDTIVTQQRTGSGLVCKPLDLDIAAEPGGSCIVESFRQLTPTEIAAVPAKLRP